MLINISSIILIHLLDYYKPNNRYDELLEPYNNNLFKYYRINENSFRTLK